ATNDEVRDFLSRSFIKIDDNYSEESVKTANRKRIALAIDTLRQFSSNDNAKIFQYIRDYCEDIPIEDNAFKVSNEEQLKKVLYGIEQRYYMTPIGAKKRLANSIQEISHH
ncbi:TPA: hypothetical protein ACT9NA_003165, partial [Legionella pneumophila]